MPLKTASSPLVLCLCLGGGMTQGPYCLEFVGDMSLPLALPKSRALLSCNREWSYRAEALLTVSRTQSGLAESEQTAWKWWYLEEDFG